MLTRSENRLLWFYLTVLSDKQRKFRQVLRLSQCKSREAWAYGGPRFEGRTKHSEGGTGWPVCRNPRGSGCFGPGIHIRTLFWTARQDSARVRGIRLAIGCIGLLYGHASAAERQVQSCFRVDRR